MKTTNFNLIILDESGSMISSKAATISGCNETLNVARNVQKESKDVMRTLVSIYAFQSSGQVPSRYLIKNKDIEDVNDVHPHDYKPDGLTPLLDAVGSTLVDLMSIASTHEDSTATVTIITDGYENASVQYDWGKVARIISQCKELGWTINFIGANIDVDEVASKMNIDNAMAYHSDADGSKDMWDKFNSQNLRHACRFRDSLREEADLCMEEKIEKRKSRASRFFSPEESD